MPTALVRPVLALLIAAVALPVASAAASGYVSYGERAARGAPAQVTVVVRSAAAFRVSFRAPTQGRTQLFLLGAKAPKGGPLLDTATTACQGAAGSWICSGSYEPLPAGTYTFRIVRRTGAPAAVELKVRW